MITIEELRAYGANVEEALQRCMNNEGFYLMLIEKAVKDTAFEELKTAVNANDLDSAFEAAHKLKGAVGNLALTPICEPVNEMVELLRNRTQTDYTGYLAQIEAQRKRLADLL